MTRSILILLLFCLFPLRAAVGQQNTAPTATNDAVTVDMDVATTLNVLSNDKDAEKDKLLVVDITAEPRHGWVEVADDLLTIRYTPHPGYIGRDTLEYKITDGNGNYDTADVFITVEKGKNRPPVARRDWITVEPDSEVEIDVLWNDTDPDGDELTIVSWDVPADLGTIEEDDGILVLTVAEALLKDTYNIYYTIEDDEGEESEARLRITIVDDVDDENDRPDAEEDNFDVYEDLPTILPVLLNDRDDDGDELELTAIVNRPTKGSARISNDKKSVLFTPAADATGGDKLSYEVTDGEDDDVGFVLINILPVNDDPVATTDTVVTTSGIAIDVDVLKNDTDKEDDDLVVTSVGKPAHGTAAIVKGQVRYTPAEDYFGSDSFVYTTIDGNGGTATGTVLVTVKRANTAPVAENDAVTIDEDDVVVIDVTKNDTDDDRKFSLTILTQPEHGTAAVNDNGTPANTADDKITYTPELNFAGVDSFFYKVSDEEGLADSAKVTVTVRPVNDPPSPAKITSPTNGSRLVIGGSLTKPADPTEPIEFKWNPADDPEDDEITYTWYLATATGFTRETTLLKEDVGSDLSIVLDVGTIAAALDEEDVRLAESLTVYTRVTAYDGEYSIPSETVRITMTRGTVTDVENVAELPTEFALKGNYPNPFNPSTAIRLDVPELSEVEVNVYDLTGRHVMTVPKQTLAAGVSQPIELDASALGSGVYVYRIVASGKTRSWSGSGQFVLIK